MIFHDIGLVCDLLRFWLYLPVSFPHRLLKSASEGKPLRHLSTAVDFRLLSLIRSDIHSHLSSQARLLALSEGFCQQLIIELFNLAILEWRKGLGEFPGSLSLRCHCFGKERLVQQLRLSFLRLYSRNGSVILR